jgi:hypothetical protein
MGFLENSTVLGRKIPGLVLLTLEDQMVDFHNSQDYILVYPEMKLDEAKPAVRLILFFAHSHFDLVD